MSAMNLNRTRTWSYFSWLWSAFKLNFAEWQQRAVSRRFERTAAELLNSKAAEIHASAPAPRLVAVVARPARHIARDSRGRASASRRLGWGF
jgi:hypothetical protein